MRNIFSRFSRKFWPHSVFLSVFLFINCSVFPHGVDTYNLLVKLFVEEYHIRYAQKVKIDQSQWAAYPLEKRYASFEDVYYLYLLSLADPLLQSFPQPRSLKTYEDYVVFVVMEKQVKGETAQLGRISPEHCTLQWGDEKPDHAEKVESDPIQQYELLKNSRSSSRLLLFPKPKDALSIKNWRASKLELKIRLSNPTEFVSFSWNLPDGFPLTDDKYESEIWTVAREQYAIMPMPVHQSTASN
ncbi:MAG: hypothetical protein JXR73_00995 [Candidatus Omnitrophica bacterium]|nr:hypothetical protein [Candidatus Omnitrophota bacterium]